MPVPAAVVDISPQLVAWLKARLPALGGRVYPSQAVQDDRPPYCTYLRLGREFAGDQDGPDGLLSTKFQIDFWSQTRGDCEAAVRLALGTVTDFGLLQLRGRFAPPGGDSSAPGVWVQACFLEDDFESYDEPLDGTTRGWFRACVRVVVHHEQLPR